ncbi:synaptic vesicle 2-related protein-like isoform X2 [Nylanderia fulva]|uniref:synaptic vesicle 2-related protein-like isoform X2 n=1 Tax=Nylanderia fulva TaxID=613905 RepID=UPI0010FB2BB2|nr:synaptic vesicle 2-related protein-like isoform X2 [Nylanderia fulva]
MSNSDKKSNEPYRQLDELQGSELNVGAQSTSSSHTNFENGTERSMELSSVVVIPDDTFTVVQAINALGFGKFQVKLSLFTGLCWMVDSMEITILSILSPSLHCDWGISRYQQALTTTVVFLGMMLSSTFWNNLSDRYGRKQALTLCSVLLSYYAFLSSFAPNFLWILLLRGVVGFAIGCVPQSVTLYAEFLPAKQRARCVILLDCFWALGACFEVAIALIVMPNLGWRWLLILSSIPLFIFAVISPWLPESTIFDMTTGKTDRAISTLERVARENKKSLPLGRLVMDRFYQAHHGRLKDVLSKEMCKTSTLLWLVWMSTAFCYYGIVLMTTELFHTSSEQCGTRDMNKDDSTCQLDCRLQRGDYIDLLWTTLAEFPGIFSTVFAIEKIGRRKTMACQLVMFAVVICFLSRTCLLSRAALTIAIFLARGLIAGVFQAAYVYTPEVYPTHLRSIGVSACSAMARIGAMVTPYIAQVFLQWSITGAMAIYAGTALCAAIATLALPQDPNEDTEWNDILRRKGIIPEKKKEQEVTEDQIVNLLESTIDEKTGRVPNNLEEKTVDELDELEDEEDERILEEYRQKRIAEMKELANKSKYGEVREISAEDYVQEINKAEEDVWVILHLYKSGIPLCTLVNQYLASLARKFPTTKFLKSISTTCIPNWPDNNLPTIFIYQNGNMVKQIIGPLEFRGMNLSEAELEWMLGQEEAIPTKIKEDPRPKVRDVLFSTLKINDEDANDW